MPCTIWFTGLSGAGKTTLSRLVAQQLKGMGKVAHALDADDVRKTICKDLGFSRDDRNENIRRIGWVCEQFTKAGVYVCAAAISPYDEIRKEIREKIEDFVLVYCYAPLEVLEKRDVKGLYRKAREKQIQWFTGIDDPYEVPEDYDIKIETGGSESPETSALKIFLRIQELGYL
jgi:adenylylsulfate kinase